MCVLLITRPLRVVEKWARKLVNHTSLVAALTPTDVRTVRSPSAIAVKSNFFVALFVLSLCPFAISVGVDAFVKGLSQISSFLSFCRRHSWRVPASQTGDADSSRAPGLTSGLQGSVNVHRGALLLVPQ